MSESQKSIKLVALPPGALQAYSDAYKATYRPGAHLEAHVAGLRAALSEPAPSNLDTFPPARHCRALKRDAEGIR